ncbi:hypothetical protein WJX81_000482 [Elliptochloris bilobata]|uniref:phosphatidylinositol N-acetylglucosaminyltransferase n=1 Tax=Elliptochloris bilobata TaxID=381761 RepID=A0AAW1S9X4_9CHLO
MCAVDLHGKERVLLVCDFFCPGVGGVENHILQLGQCLSDLGHKAVILTHAYKNHTGICHTPEGLKVYYAPRRPVYQQATLPTVLGGFALLRGILISERISLVHAHAAFSPMAHEALLHARTMGLRTVFTDHSLMGFADVASILVNKALKFTLADVHQVICVSHTGKENTVLRACIPPGRVAVIPNAVRAEHFAPHLSPTGPDAHRTVVALSRLVHRKGIDLLAVVVPAMCRRRPDLRFVIGGDGPKAPLLWRMVEQHGLHERVTLLGEVAADEVPGVLARGRVFLNTSLTEAFCMALVEAAAAGLLVVSTRVGGVPEVLPPSMLLLADACPEALGAALEAALDRAPSIDRQSQHRQVAAMYSWPAVAARTERVYAATARDVRDDSPLGRLRRYVRCGRVFGLLACAVAAFDMMFLHWLEWWQPAYSIDLAPNY